jgi:hypothetical protein
MLSPGLDRHTPPMDGPGFPRDSANRQSLTSPSLRITSFVFEALTLFFLLLNFANIRLGDLELLVGGVTVVLGIIMLVASHHVRGGAKGAAILQIALGLCGVGSFVWTFIDAFSLFLRLHS